MRYGMMCRYPPYMPAKNCLSCKSLQSKHNYRIWNYFLKSTKNTLMFSIISGIKENIWETLYICRVIWIYLFKYQRSWRHSWKRSPGQNALSGLNIKGDPFALDLVVLTGVTGECTNLPDLIVTEFLRLRLIDVNNALFYWFYFLRSLRALGGQVGKIVVLWKTGKWKKYRSCYNIAQSYNLDYILERLWYSENGKMKENIEALMTLHSPIIQKRLWYPEKQ